jgi:class 3 adenylate cyclase/transcriptional regulator with XRE-family HTH domain
VAERQIPLLRQATLDALVRTFLIADLRGYTAYTLEHGDAAGATLARRFAALAMEVMEAWGGTVTELRGDEALAVFTSARQALHAAVDLQERCAQEWTRAPEVPLLVGIGLDAGEAIPVGDGYRGTALNLAARLCSLAGAGEVLASAGVIHLARRTEGLAYTEREPVMLKGFAKPVAVVQVTGVAPPAPQAVYQGGAGRIAAFRGPTPFGELLRRHREAAALSQERLAERAGLSTDAISALERGKRGAPRLETAGLLADALGLAGEERATFIAAARAVGAPVADTPSEQPAAFAPLLRRHRRDAGLTQEALAERAGISLRAVSDLERGIYRTPHRDTVALLAQALGLTQQQTAFLEASVVRLRGPASQSDAPSADDPLPLPVLPPAIEQLSPFVAGPPIVHPARFFGHERILKRLFALWRLPPFQNAALIGPRRSGKTSLLLYLKSITTTPPDRLRPGQRRDWLSAPESYRWIYVDFQDPRLGSQDGLLTYLLDQMGQPAPGPCTMERFLDVMADRLRTPTVVLLDEIGVALHRYAELDDRFWEGLRSLATTQGGGRLAFVLAAHESPTDLAAHTGHSSPFFNLFAYAATVGPLMEAEARDLVASAPLPFALADVDWMVAQSGCWSLLLQILCRERLHALQEGEADDAWREDGLQQLAPFRYLLDGA